MDIFKNSARVATLSNGIRVVGECIPYFPSATVGVWIGAGSGFETPETNGLSHFIEHMLFKSTENRSILDIAKEIDYLGGNVNAFTSKECTCYYAKVIEEHLPRVMALFSDILMCCRFEPEELERERGVILEEIAMSADTPDDTVLELLAEAYFGDHPLGLPILGFEDKIASVSREEILDYKAKNYRPDNIVISITGMFDFDAFVELCEKLFGGLRAREHTASVPNLEEPAYKAIIREKDIEQVHIAQAWPGVGHKDKRLYPLSVACNLLGGGNASRLFQKIREEMGAAYSVYSYPSVYARLGSIVVYAATSPENAQKVSHALHEEIHRMIDTLDPTEFEMSKEQMRVSFILGIENGFTRMSALGRGLLLNNELQEPREVMDRMSAVTFEQVREEIARTFSGKYAVAAVGQKVGDLLL